MLYADGVVGLALLALWVYCLLDVITSDPAAVRNLPKLLWFAVVLLLGALGIGPALWLYAGRPRGAGRTGTRAPVRRRAPRPGPGEGRNPDDDVEFLAGLKARAEQQREQARRERGDDGPTPG